MKILVKGNSPICAATQEALQLKGHEVVTARKDATDLDAIFYYSGKIPSSGLFGNVAEYLEAQVSEILGLLSWAIANSPKAHIVLGSSSAVYGEGSHNCSSCGVVFPEQKGIGQCPHCRGPILSVPTRENRPLYPSTPFGCAKKLQEDIAKFYSTRLNFSVLRYFNVYGHPEIDSFIHSVAKKIIDGAPIPLVQDGIQILDFVHIDDVVRANISALESPTPNGTVINIGAGVEISHFEIVRLCEEIVGVRLSSIDEVGVINIHSCYADLTRAHRMLGYSPLVGAREGIARLLTEKSTLRKAS